MITQVELWVLRLCEQLAPEVLVGKLYDGFSTDVWGLGVILFILLSATPPFHGDCHSELVRNIVGGEFARAVLAVMFGRESSAVAPVLKFFTCPCVIFRCVFV